MLCGQPLEIVDGPYGCNRVSTPACIPALWLADAVAALFVLAVACGLLAASDALSLGSHGMASPSIGRGPGHAPGSARWLCLPRQGPRAVAAVPGRVPAPPWVAAAEPKARASGSPG